MKLPAQYVIRILSKSINLYKVTCPFKNEQLIKLSAIEFQYN